MVMVKVKVIIMSDGHNGNVNNNVYLTILGQKWSWELENLGGWGKDYLIAIVKHCRAQLPELPANFFIVDEVERKTACHELLQSPEKLVRQARNL